MLDSNSLMIGNVIDFYNPYASDDTKPSMPMWRGLIKEIASDGFQILKINPLSDRALWVPFNDTFPIPLSPEILEACGFEYGERADELQKATNYEGDYLTVNFRSGNAKFGSPVQRCGCDCHTTIQHGIADIKYLHKLQNSFLFLSGQPLQLNLESLKLEK